MGKLVVLIAIFGLTMGSSLAIGFLVGQRYGLKTDLLSPIFTKPEIKDNRLQQYSIPNLDKLNWPNSSISLTNVLKTADTFTSYQFSYETIGGRMTGLINIPLKVTDSDKPKVILLIRGYVPLETYQPGVGTRAAGEALANAGYITLAPDFLGYGESQAEPSDVLEARFIKPAQIMQLVELIENQGVPVPALDQLTDAPLIKTDRLGIWAHSNGGQIALSALEGSGRKIPTTLWAPVTAPFPYSILFFTDEEDDEGKAARASMAVFEKNYDAFDFSLTKHLNLLTGPLQLHQGTNDEAVPMVWSREFKDKISSENKRRLNLKQARLKLTQAATISATPSLGSPTEAVNPDLYEPIVLTYFEYLGADHNMKPGWEQAMMRDLEFFGKYIL